MASGIDQMAMAVWALRLAPASALFALMAGGLCFGESHYVAHRPLAITACGQTADALNVSLLSARLHLDHVFDKSLSADKLRGIRTLVVVIGGSVKGLAGGQIDEERETSRVRTLLAKARQRGVGIIGVHVGGESRRAGVSDRLIELVIDQADYLIVTAAGNRDGLFTAAARTRMIPLVIVSETEDVARELRAVMASQ